MGQSLPPKKRSSTDVTMAPPTQAAKAKTAATSSPASGSEPANLGDVQPGKRIGKYAILRLIGRGGMGAVFEAKDVTLGRKVALKILPQEFSANEESLQRFLREARLAAQLNHPNTVAVYDIGKKGTIYYIAMELVNGSSGQEILDNHKQLSCRKATRAIIEAGKGLAAAHAAGMTHRDIKPANLLWAENGSVKLSDFGLAKPTKTTDLSLTQRDQFVGTPLYMSPEQCRNDNVDHRSDIYALGATYFTLLTGQAPFNEGSAIQILLAHCSAPIPDVSQRIPDLPPLCAYVIQKAMAKQPEDRYQSVDAMLVDLKAILGGSTAAGSAAGHAALLEAVEHSAQPVAAPTQPDALSAFLTPSMVKWLIGGTVAVLGLGIVLAIVMGRRSGSEVLPQPVAQVTMNKPLPAASVNVVDGSTTVAPPATVAPATEPVATVAPPTSAPVVAVLSPTVAPTPATGPVAAAMISNQLPQPATQPAGAVAAAPEPTTKPTETAPPPPPESAVAQTPPETNTPPQPRSGDGPPESRRRPAPPPQNNGGGRMTMEQHYALAKQYANTAKASHDDGQIQEAAQILMLWHDFFLQMPRQRMPRQADEAQQLAEKLKPGISKITPRVTPDIDDPMMPPPAGTLPPEEQGQDPNQPPDQNQGPRGPGQQQRSKPGPHSYLR